MLKRVNIICGHYGSGKTNLALNLAVDLHRRGGRVTVVDLDIVNPYFRTADYTKLLHSRGVKVISPATACTAVDAPALTAEVMTVFDKTDEKIIIDVGGDDAGAFALGRFSKKVYKQNDFTMLFVINRFRKLIATPREAVELLREVEGASGIRATGIVNNSHLAGLTAAEDILDSLPYAEQTAQLAGLPLVMTTAPKHLENELTGRVLNLYPVEIIVKLPWN